jgi:hypothetical protein
LLHGAYVATLIKWRQGKYNMARKSLEIYLGEPLETRTEALNRVAKRAGFASVSEWLRSIADTESENVAAAIVGYIQLTRRVATSDHECSECGNEIGNLDLYLQVYANGKTGAVVCSDCATE